MTETLQDIIKGCKRRKRSAQAALFRKYSKKMFGISIIYTKDQTQAEDVVQEGFLKIFENIKQYSGKGSFEGWMRRIMINTALEHFRKEKYMFPVSEPLAYSNDVSYDDIISSISAGDLLQLIHELSPQYRMVFNLFAIEGYSHQEIAEKLDVSVSSSKSNLSRARKILQQRIEEQYATKRKTHKK